MAIGAIDGMAGIGKTALVVQAAHRMSRQFPDGQLFIDLHGFTKTVAPVAPAEALDRLLRMLGVPGERIPCELDDRAALWRNSLAGRRMLIVLDNAATEAQVVPLLPGAPRCLVLVTSRRRLAGLDATHMISLDTLPIDEAVALFAAAAAGQPQLIGRPDVGGLLVEAMQLCGQLPLAIRIAAARLRGKPVAAVADLRACRDIAGGALIRLTLQPGCGWTGRSQLKRELSGDSPAAARLGMDTRMTMPSTGTVPARQRFPADDHRQSPRCLSGSWCAPTVLGRRASGRILRAPSNTREVYPHPRAGFGGCL